MTREEQIKGLYALKEYLTKNPIELDGHESLPITLIDYAIEALEQETTTKNDLGVDYIDRNSIKYYLGTGGYMYASKGEIDKLPSVTPQEPRRGHWIPTYGNVKCSVCGSVKDSREVGKATHYCDFCGAKMIESQESEDKE